MDALFPDLNRAILLLAPIHDAAPLAPATEAEIAQHYFTRNNLSTPLRVWDGASERTIFGDAKVNHAFRAWHDNCHILSRGAFTLDGERRACQEQIRQLRNLWPQVPERLERVLWNEVIGQAEYRERHGFFPVDQRAFALEALSHVTIMKPTMLIRLAPTATRAI